MKNLAQSLLSWAIIQFFYKLYYYKNQKSYIVSVFIIIGRDAKLLVKTIKQRSSMRMRIETLINCGYSNSKRVKTSYTTGQFAFLQIRYRNSPISRKKFQNIDRLQELGGGTHRHISYNSEPLKRYRMGRKIVDEKCILFSKFVLCLNAPESQRIKIFLN